METKKHRNIVRLSTSNVKRLSAVEIEPDGNLVVITGKNGHGKSSVLDSIWLALSSKDASKQVVDALKHGEKEGHATVDLGDIVVTRKWKRTIVKSDDADGVDVEQVKSTITVASKDGAEYKSPQALLDSMMATLAFDPMKFSQMKQAEQTKALLQAIGKSDELEALETKRDKTFTERTDINRRKRDKDGELESVPHVGGIDDDATEKNVSELAGKLSEYREHNRAVESASHNMIGLLESVTEAETRLESARRAVEVAKKENADTGSIKPTEDLEAEISGADEYNRNVRSNKQRQQITETIAELIEQSTQKTEEIAKIDTDKTAILENAELPVKGLGVSDKGVTVDGVAFKDCSTSMQIRVSVAMAMALNPSLRVTRITDGSLLDDDAMKMLAEMATEHDFQIWIERVDSDDQGAIVIEDGAVKS